MSHRDSSKANIDNQICQTQWQINQAGQLFGDPVLFQCLAHDDDIGKDNSRVSTTSKSYCEI